ncbi:Glycosyl hydrolase family 20, domain 2 [Zhouia amylolytica]|uniref:beta-N-acetylhexosaminidase n=1 Tax=Zhouia amylolytica TaxID=376730 RepID=A0A1I6TAU0_9FLAO|nr:family 20 glycosylhydrolase [Zhouia amylolytica]SFS86326.1 Glycosyl hydrolase family 20, domain 2 [Zhouia amylolytica]
MKKLFLTLFASLLTFSLSTELKGQNINFETNYSAEELHAAPVKLIPYPQEVVWGLEMVNFLSFKVTSENTLNKNITSELERICSEYGIENSKHSKVTIKFISDEEVPLEGYELNVEKNKITIKTSGDAGAFYALQTLRQLISNDKGKSRIQLCNIKDQPAFPIRGYMVDVGRNFQSIELLKTQLDVMANYKLNTFHWHLTDRPAWRIESKAYPELTGAENHRPTRDPGAFYTYEEIRALILYAKDKHIQVIPEIDMPGHSDSFVTATGHKMESPEGMKILEKVLNEFFDEVPKELCPVIHIGSDEVRIENPEVFITKMVAICEANEREVIIWNPGLPANDNVIRQTWKPDHIEEKTYKEIDSWNNYINNGDPFVHISKLFFKPIGKGSTNKVQGGILCMWHDVNLDKEDDFIRFNPLYPSMLTYAWKTWTHDVKTASKEYLTKIPLSGTSEHTYFQAFEKYLIQHKEKYFANKPFQYVEQSQNQWKLMKFADSLAIEMTMNSIREKFDQKDRYKLANGNTIYVKDRFKLGGYYPDAQPGETCFALSYIYAEGEKEISVWVGFETPFRANRVYGGMPDQGAWDAHGGDVWINGENLPAPEWKNPGWKPSKTSGWGNADDQEITWKDEELYWTREPVMVPLKKGWNEILIKVPGTNAYQNWMFTFAPLEENIVVNPFKAINGK